MKRWRKSSAMAKEKIHTTDMIIALPGIRSGNTFI
jgi:hypothetical protein